MRIARLMILALACLAWASLPDAAEAQMMGGGMMPFGSPFGTFAPNSGFMPGMGGFGNPQMNAMMGMRMMQGMGGMNGVQTGMANPFWNGYGQQPSLYYDQPVAGSSASSGSSKHGSSTSKREEARAKRAEQKRLAAEAKAKLKSDKAAKKSHKQTT